MEHTLKYVEHTDFTGKAYDAIEEWRSQYGLPNDSYNGWAVGNNDEGDNGYGTLSIEEIIAVNSQLKEWGYKDGDDVNIHVWW